MKRRSSSNIVAVAIGLIALTVLHDGRAFAQMPGMGGGAGSMNGAMVALFGSNTAFSARADFRVFDRNQREIERMPLTYAFSNGKMRMDIDLTQFKSTDMSSQFLSTLKQFGMDQTTVIARPDKKLTWSVYPHAKSYAEIPMSKEEVSAQAARYQFTRTPQGRETVDGHDCEKIKVTLTDPKGEKTEATVWNAADLRSFPIQMKMAVDVNNTMTINFRDVKLTAPDDRQFEPPGSLTKYDSAEALLDALSKHSSPTAQ